MSKLTMLLILSSTAVCINCIYSDEELGEHCGDKIPKILSLVCNGLYFDPKPKKPTWKFTDPEILQPIPKYEEYLQSQRRYLTDKKEIQSEIENIKYPFQNRLKAFNIIQNRFKRDKIVDECCKKACTIAEIKTYCG